MQYLNLTQGFEPFGKLSNFNFKVAKFSGGEPYIKLDLSHSKFIAQESDILITCRLKSTDDVMLLLMAHDALNRSGYFNRIHAFIPYFPAARHDAIFNEGESLSVAVYAKLINDLKLASVTIYDPHSAVTPALLKDVIVEDNHKFVLEALKQLYPGKMDQTPLLVSPDAGAEKKVFKLAKYLSAHHTLQVVTASKIRNTSTGDIIRTAINGTDDLSGKTCIIVDDICDGGRTFIELAKLLKVNGAEKVVLIASHAIFSHGTIELSKHIDQIFTTDSWRSTTQTANYTDASGLITVINFNVFL